MKKEYTLVVTIGLFIVSYIFDFLAGVVKITARNPIVYLSTPNLTQYPLTSLEIGLRTLGLILTVVLTLSIMEKKYFAKAGINLFLAIVAIFYAIQQMATKGTLTPIQWTLSFAYAGIILLPLTGIYLLVGIMSGLHSTLTKSKHEEQKDEDNKAPSILTKRQETNVED